MPVELALYQPDIAQNTGTVLRLSACLGFAMHIIHPTGFAYSRRELKRGGLDYLDQASVTEHDSYAHFDSWRRSAGKRMVLLTTKTRASTYDARFAEGDVLVFGRESAGVPDSVARDAELKLRIPMREGLRSINVAMSAAMAMSEALRQTGHFGTLS
ncbi:MAG TPA: tRNA (cytidine(34)-2'-O)-methyltransferase [Devosia sp.]|nr:tRNA (cytidine(34)-2'-O)-methyltransferase [Devosia sp.]